MLTSNVNLQWESELWIYEEISNQYLQVVIWMDKYQIQKKQVVTEKIQATKKKKE